MNHARKMVLVPEGTLERLEKRQNVNTPPLTARLNGLDSEIQQVLKDKNLSEEEKVLNYSQALQNYLHFYQERKNEPINVRIQATNRPNTAGGEPAPQEAHEEGQAPPQAPTQARAQSGELNERQVLAALPKTMKDPAKSLIQKIKENPDIMTWDKKGQIVLNGQVLEGTHITDLVKDSVGTSSKKDGKGPLGWELFTQGLARMNAPEHLLRNSRRKSALRNYKSGKADRSEESISAATAKARDKTPEESNNEWFPTPLQAPSPAPSKNSKSKAGKEKAQRWLKM